MKLELKHLAGYLPYGLGLVARNVLSETPRRIYSNLNAMNIMSLIEGDTLYKPILHPLSDLTKEIEVNGEKFVPIVELLKLEYPTQEKTGRYSEITVSENGFPNAFYKYQANRCLTIYTSHIDGISFWNIKKLIEWHFDIYGLIEENLAIDINTLK